MRRGKLSILCFFSFFWREEMDFDFWFRMCVCVCEREREREKALTQKEIHTFSSKMLFPIWCKGKPNWMKGGVG